MPRKGLVVYASYTGNTEKVAIQFKQVFKEQGWECDCVKLAKQIEPVNPEDYDLVCVGSPIVAGVPVKELERFWMGMMTKAAGSVETSDGDSPAGGLPPGSLSWRQDPAKYKKSVVFVTYTGSRRGPAEAIPSLDLMELRMEDQGFRCIGKLACPGKHGGSMEPPEDQPANPSVMRDWHWNQQSRPHERDLQKAATFLAEILEDYFLPDEAPPDSQYICIA